MITLVHSQHYHKLLDVWEDSVRATHDFITEQDIAAFKPMIMEQAFPAVTLYGYFDTQGNIVGFIGVAGQKLEMLFIQNAQRGKGIGTELFHHALHHHHVNQVDVNEQNPQAVGFYQRMGFNIASRSPVDDMGKPFPILHMTR